VDFTRSLGRVKCDISSHACTPTDQAAKPENNSRTTPKVTHTHQSETFGERGPTTTLHEVFAPVRQTAAAHTSALDELERAFSAQTVSTKNPWKRSVLLITTFRNMKKKNDKKI
jgi:hypothetical protein